MDLKVALIGLVFLIKYIETYYNYSFGGSPDKFLLNHLPKPVIYHNYKKNKILSSNYVALIAYIFSM